MWRMTGMGLAATTLFLAVLKASASDARFRQSLPSAATGTEGAARAACGQACHAFPPPDLLPRSAWHDTIARMAIIRQGGTEPVGPPGTAARLVKLDADLQPVLAYYLANAPERLPAPTPWPEADTSGFTVRPLSPPDAPPGPAISHLRLLDVDGDGKPEIVATDMRYGMILRGAAAGPSGRLDVVATAQHPSHIAMVDLDGDGAQDFLVADLGRFLPSDHTQGAVTWLRGDKAGRYAALSLDGWPRVADVEAGDFNGDGKADLAVAAFGWRKVGRLSILANHTTDYIRPSFTEHVVDSRPGSVHGVPVDLNGDGRLDVVALIAQQFETVIAYLNTGASFTFTPTPLYTAPHPNWGSSGIDPVDFDRDGDLDVLLTHGDTFDDQIIKPYHGIMWLENRGTFPFEPHPLAQLPGVFRAEAGDLDGDGDLDVVACAFIAGGSDLDQSRMPALVWLEQVRPGVFERRTLLRREPRLATLDLGDADGDGDLDIVVGTFMTEERAAPWIEVWENRRVNRP